MNRNGEWGEGGGAARQQVQLPVGNARYGCVTSTLTPCIHPVVVLTSTRTGTWSAVHAYTVTSAHSYTHHWFQHAVAGLPRGSCRQGGADPAAACAAAVGGCLGCA